MTVAARFDAQTLERLLETLAGFSGEGPGVTRLAYDDHWCEAHHWLRGEARRRELDVAMDAAGNLFFYGSQVRPGDLGRSVLMVGSHLDSVKHGGKYDGAYGTIAGLLLAERHREMTDLPVVGFVTCEEEQSRFDSHMMGARSLLGQVQAKELDQVRDADGVSWRQALAAMRSKDCAAPLAAGGRPIPTLFRPGAEIELHIEQGPVLEADRIPLGIVEHIAGYCRLSATVTGEARHTGTTPIPNRHDALLASAEMALAMESLAREFGGAARATAGNVRVQPGLYNVVPGACEVWLEVRHIESAQLDALCGEVVERCRAIAERRGVQVTTEVRTRQDPTPLSRTMADHAESVAHQRELPFRRMPSGAAHDTMEFARAGAEALLLFVPSRAGISHSPDEFTSTAELWAGIEFASALIERIAREGA